MTSRKALKRLSTALSKREKKTKKYKKKSKSTQLDKGMTEQNLTKLQAQVSCKPIKFLAGKKNPW
jgi:hypothetical protein